MQLNMQWSQLDQLPVIEGCGAKDVECAMRCFKIFRPHTWGYYYEEYLRILANERDQILMEYKGILSDMVRNSITMDCEYQIESIKIFSKSVNERGSDKYKLDSLLMLDINMGYMPSYNQFISLYAKWKREELLSISMNYKEKLLFNDLLLIGYPKYILKFRIIKSAIQDGDITMVEDYYKDFESSVGNNMLKHKLSLLYNQAKNLEKGKILPIQIITDYKDDTIHINSDHLTILDIDVTKYSEYFLYKTTYDQIEEVVAADKRLKQINIIIVRPSSAKGKLEELHYNEHINFTYVYVSDDQSEMIKSLQLPDYAGILFLDSDAKILDNFFNIPYYNANYALPAALDVYFNSLNKPSSQADTSRLFVIIFISIIVFGLLSWLVIRIRTSRIKKRERTRRQLAELELKAIRSQMNPHFIFNALGSIQNLINQNKTKKANLYLSRFARLMRMVLANSNKKLVSLATELELLQHYMELEQLRVDFNFTIDIGKDVDPEMEEIPGMLIQPFVENAIIHGITPKGEGNVDVIFSKKEEVLECIVADDGVGINAFSNDDGNGIAMKLSAKRLDLLNSQWHSNMHLKVESRCDVEKTDGTKITLLIPVA